MDTKQICDWIKEGQSLTQVAKKCKCDRSVIRRLCIEGGVEIPKTNKDKFALKQDEITKTVNLYQQNWTLKEIAKVLGTNREKIKRALRLGGVNLRERTITKIDESYFKQIDTQDKAYILGFIFADGCVFESKGILAGFRVQIKESDRCILDYMKKCLAADYPVTFIPRNDCENQVALTVTNVNLAQQLIALGCTPRKSQVVKFPSINSILMPHFLRGYFDGDGGVGSSHKYYVYPCATICASYDFAIELRKICLTLGIKSDLRKVRGIWKVTFHKRNAMKFMNYIYQGATFSLGRKQNRFLFFKQYYENAGYGKVWRPIRHKEWQELKLREISNKKAGN